MLARQIRLGMGRIVEDMAGADLLKTGDGLQQFLLAGTGHARNAQNLAAVGLETDVLEDLHPFVVEAVEALDLQTQVLVFGLGTVDLQLDRPAHHHLGELLGIGLGSLHRADVFALAQHCHPVGNGHDLVELVGDDDNGLAVGLHVAQDGKELFGLLGSEDGGGLVQNEDIRSPVEDFQDLHPLLLGDRHLVDLLVGVNVKAVFFADGPDVLGQRLPVQPSLALEAQDDILRRGQHIHQLEMLVDHADAQIMGVLGGPDGHRPAVRQDLSAVGEIDAGEHIHQGGLAAAVFAQQGEDLSLVQGEGNLVVCHHVAEGLGQLPQLDGVLGRHRLTSLFEIPKKGRDRGKPRPRPGL